MPHGPRRNGSLAAVGLLLFLGGFVPSERMDGTTSPSVALVATSSFAVGSFVFIDEHDPFGRPLSLDPATEITELAREGYVVGYEGRWKIPAWTAHREEGKWFGANAPRFNRLSRFLVDPDLPPALCLTHDHYTRTGFDRGHMSADADMDGRSAELHRQSYYMSNVAPQYPALNQQIWKNLESRIRDWAKSYGELWVVTGPIFERPEHIRWRHSSTMGRDGEFAVPTHFFKLVIRREGAAFRGLAFVMPNRKKAFSDNFDYAAWQKSIDEVERDARLDFFAGLDDSAEERVEAGVESLWD